MQDCPDSVILAQALAKADGNCPHLQPFAGSGKENVHFADCLGGVSMIGLGKEALASHVQQFCWVTFDYLTNGCEDVRLVYAALEDLSRLQCKGYMEDLFWSGSTRSLEQLWSQTWNSNSIYDMQRNGRALVVRTVDALLNKCWQSGRALLSTGWTDAFLGMSRQSGRAL